MPQGTREWFREWFSVGGRCFLVMQDDVKASGFVLASAPADSGVPGKAARLNREGGSALASCHAAGRTFWTAGRRHRFAHQTQ